MFMGLSTPSNLYSQSFGTTPSTVAFVSTKNPSPTDLNGISGPFKLGQIWVNSLTNGVYILTSFTSFNGQLNAVWSIPGYSLDAPYFFAYQSTELANVTGDEDVFTFVLDSVYYSQGDGYNLNTGLFTAPKDGIYQFNVSAYLTGLVSNNTQLRLEVWDVPSGNTFPLLNINPFSLALPSNELQISGSCQVYSYATQAWQAKLRVSGNGSENVGIYGTSSYFGTSFSGKLIG